MIDLLNFVKIGDYKIAYVDGMVTLPSVAKTISENNNINFNQNQEDFPERMEVCLR